jgi:hypothetical protein
MVKPTIILYRLVYNFWCFLTLDFEINNFGDGLDLHHPVVHQDG